ncbi:unnamed protein product [Paramecium octaurelia]|uniref:Uncharacterized protein n=1 Tax=Paramecium octaurelia TaxID=43137 RepID=A0A8S1XFS2_PAROT|nr:unnamed protein product [Paramecium octaurelia]
MLPVLKYIIFQISLYRTPTQISILVQLYSRNNIYFNSLEPTQPKIYRTIHNTIKCCDAIFLQQQLNNSIFLSKYQRLIHTFYLSCHMYLFIQLSLFQLLLSSFHHPQNALFYKFMVLQETSLQFYQIYLQSHLYDEL